MAQSANGPGGRLPSGLERPGHYQAHAGLSGHSGSAQAGLQPSPKGLRLSARALGQPGREWALKLDPSGLCQVLDPANPLLVGFEALAATLFEQNVACGSPNAFWTSTPL